MNCSTKPCGYPAILPLIVFWLSFTPFVQAQPEPVTVMSYNIRLDVASDGENAWNNRKEMLAGLLRYHHPDIIGFQEAQRHQIDFLAESLPEYSWLGVGRDDGNNGGEFMAIFYLKNRFRVLASSTFWCSPTPAVPGRGWDAAYPRVVTWGKFSDSAGGEWYVFNTHLDNVGEIARANSARQLMDSIDAISGERPVVITGDFNSGPEEKPFAIITAGASRRKFSDSFALSQKPHYGPEGTFNGFNIREYSGKPIDFIFVSRGVSVLRHATLTDSFHGRFPSDHFPVLTEIRFTNSLK